MERILTYAEFSKQFDEEGEVLGNTKQDVDALASVTDQFVAPDDETKEIGSNVEPSVSLVKVGGDESMGEVAPIKTEVEIVSDDDSSVADEDEDDVEELEDEDDENVA